MCGIAGVAALDPRTPLEAAVLGPMLACVRHRGPDDEGVHLQPGIALGHRRLSIIDLEHGHQPLFGARPTTAIVVNGEIYNFRELRRELSALGHAFRTASDSEVAAHAYDAWGLDFVSRLDGMFAIALWDGETRRLVLARDRMGEKPLFYATAAGQFIFASELSALLAHPAVPRELDPVSLSQYLALEYVPAPRSMVARVHKLEPGTMVILEGGTTSTRTYWRLQPQTPRTVLPYPDAVRELRARLERAVRSRLVADVPLGVFLSGGIDSSTVAAIAARAGTLETFGIGFEEASFDESRWARAVAAHIGSRHHEHVVTAASVADEVPGLGGWLDEPIGDASILPTAVLSRFARRHVTVALGGDGGDELFAGYPMHQAQRFARALRWLPRPAFAAMGAAARALPVSERNFDFAFRVRTFLRGAAEPPPFSHAFWMSSFTPLEQAALLTPALLQAAGDAARALEPVARSWQASAGAPLLARATHLDATTYLPNDILAKVDRASMAVGLEVRAPFLAPELVEFAFALPDAYRMRGLAGKRILKDAVRDLLPAGVIDRPKKGFGMPVGAWLNGALAPLADDVFAPAQLAAAGIFRPAPVQRLLTEHRARRADNRKQLWTLLVFELWRRAHRIQLPAALS